jgi:hypothetical protein
VAGSAAEEVFSTRMMSAALKPIANMKKITIVGQPETNRAFVANTKLKQARTPSIELANKDLVDGTSMAEISIDARTGPQNPGGRHRS